MLSLAVTAAWGIQRLEFDASYEAYFSERNPQLAAYRAFQRVYSRSDNILLVLAPRDGQVFSRETLSAVEWLTEQAWQIPWSRRVDSISNFQHTEAQGDELIVSNLVDRAQEFSDRQLDEVRGIALAEPLLRHRLIAAARRRDRHQRHRADRTG